MYELVCVVRVRVACLCNLIKFAANSSHTRHTNTGLTNPTILTPLLSAYDQRIATLTALTTSQRSELDGLLERVERVTEENELLRGQQLKEVEGVIKRVGTEVSRSSCLSQIKSSPYHQLLPKKI